MMRLAALVLLSVSCKKAQYADTATPSDPPPASAASADTGAPPPTLLDCSSINWDGWADGFFATYCRACHSVSTAARYGATEGVNFDTRADAIRWAERIRIRVLEEETMPLGGGVVRSDLEPLQRWLECVGEEI